MNYRIKDITNQRFGRLVVLEPTEQRKQKKVVWKCLCDCGNEVYVDSSSLSSHNTKSCGCLSKDIARTANLQHGYKNTPTYNSWTTMKSRCSNSKLIEFCRYGGCGVKVCERWNDFKNFLEDMGQRPEGKTLDRIDPYGDYEPKNCRWATPLEQRHNRRKRCNKW